MLGILRRSFCQRMKLRPNRVASQRGNKRPQFKIFRKKSKKIRNKSKILSKKSKNFYEGVLQENDRVSSGGETYVSKILDLELRT